MIDISNENEFKKNVIEASKPVLVDFWADWCQPCKILTPILEEIENEYNHSFSLVKVNVQNNELLASQFQITNIPDVKLFQNGEIVTEFKGILSKEQIKEFLEPFIVSPEILKAKEMFSKGMFEDVLYYLKNNEISGKQTSQLIWDSVVLLLKDKSIDEKIKLLDNIPNYGDQFSNQKKFLADFFQSSPSEEEISNFQLLFTDQAENALEFFLERVSSSKEKDIPKKKLFACFSVLGNANPVVLKFRKKLSSVIF